MGRKKEESTSKFARFLQPLLNALRKLGGSGRPTEVKRCILEALRISEDSLGYNKSGETKFSNRVDWARFYLARTGYLASSTRGVWTLTEKGRIAEIDQATAAEIIRQANKELQPDKSGQEAEIDEATEPPQGESVAVVDYRERTLQLLKSLPAKGFEDLCQLVLRESGFDEVKVTGRVGDQGIDGQGVLRVNAFVSFRILYQCKRWSSSVGPSTVRDFRGAMAGRAEKGIILTTDFFTAKAKDEARRDGAQPVELVDGESLVELLAKLELGLKPKRTYEVDDEFFRQFRE